MARSIREVDLSSTGLGSIDTWPPSLRTAANICLTSRFPMVLWWGPELSMLYNDAYAHLIGDKHPGALGRSGPEVFPEIWPDIGPMLSQVMEQGTATWSEDQLLVLDRHGFPEECYFTYSFSPIRDESGTVSGVFTAVTETTDRVLVDRRLRTLSGLAEHTRDAVTAVEAAHGAMRTLTGVPEDLPFVMLYLIQDDSAACISSSGVVGPEAVPDHVELDGEGPDPWQLRATIREGRPRAVDLPPTMYDTSERAPDDPAHGASERAMVHPLMDAGAGKAIGALVLGISARRPFDQEYRGFLGLVADQTAKGIDDAGAAELERDRLAALAELNRAKTEFFSNVSHEFRTPLTLLQGPLLEALADQDDPLPQRQRRRLEMANRNADRMVKLVNALLDFSRLESGRMNASYRATDLSTLTRELASVFPSAVARAGLDYHLDIRELPREVYIDREMWEKVVFNLLSNAIKFTFEGRISLCLRDAGDHAELVVEDTGAGIPDEEMPHLFERFHRVRGAKARSQEGTGIGLALVRELVTLHGGSIDVTSEVDRGTRFAVRIPYGSSHLPEDQIDAEPVLATTAVAASAYLDEATGWSDEQLDEHARRSDPGDTGGSHILVVDDNADMRTYLSRLLDVHWQVRTAADGASALAEARRQRPDLILSDVMMPGLDGFELLQELRRDPDLEHVPVVLLSARASETSRVEGLDGGADDYLVKPFTVAELVARVRSNLRLSQQRIQTADVRARQAMLAGLSHEMQTPLAAILGSIAVVDQGPIPDDTQPAFDIMRRQASQLRGLVQRFLDFSRLEADKDPVLLMDDHDPVELVANAVEVCGDTRVRVEPADGGLPLVRADADRVEQILTNLCTNAIKYSGSDAPVEVGILPDGDKVVFEVRDQGVGIPPHEAEQVFDKFFRGRSGDRIDGTGLGLYVSRALAEAMGGSLSLRSSNGQPGTTFVLKLPAA